MDSVFYTILYTRETFMPNKSSPFVAEIDPTLAPQLQKDLLSQGFELTKPTYTLFSARKKGVTCTLYTSGKLVVQGKEMKEFIEFYLEPQILKTLVFTNPLQDMDLTPRIGIDESGKGDFFGPLCVAGVYATSEQIPQLVALGVCDSKKLNDALIRKLAPKIKALCAHHTIKIGPAKYNELYAQFKNLNSLLAWGHASTIEALVNGSKCTVVTIDQFADERVVERALAQKKVKVDLTQRHRGEEDIVVAAASILARDLFLNGLDQLSKKYNIELPKGASSLITTVGRRFVQEHGVDALAQVCKMHFKTLDSIVK